MRRAPVLGLLSVVAMAVGCADHVPDQDLRILTAQPAAKLSASDLWRDFEKDAAAAKRTYFGQAIDVSDRPTEIQADSPTGPVMYFSQTPDRGVRARLLSDRAAETLKDAAVGQRITLRCYCDGLDDRRDVVLKSCIRP